MERWIEANGYVKGLANELTSLVEQPAGFARWGAPDTPQKQAAVYRAWRAAARALQEDRAIPADAKMALRDGLNQVAKWALGELTAAGLGQADTWAETLTPQPKVRTTADELRHARLWGQLQRELDAGTDPAALIARANRDELEVLADELPSMARAAHRNDPTSLGAATAKVNESLKARRFAIADAAERMRLSTLEEVETGKYRIGLVGNHLTHAIQTGNLDYGPGVPAWSGDELISTSDTAPAAA